MKVRPRDQVFIKAFFILGISLWMQCKKFLAVPDSVDQPSTAQLFNSDSTAMAAVNGIYSEMMQSGMQFCSGQTTLIAGLSSDELILYETNLLNGFAENTIDPAEHSLLSRAFWQPAYHYIYTANLCLKNLAKNSALSAAINRQLTAECAFIRAFCYFYLVNLFGPIPLITVTDFSVNENIARSGISQVYDQIERDLLLSIDAFDPTPAFDKSRPSRWSAIALLARVNLYREEWTEAIKHSTSIIAGSGLFLEPDPAEVFNTYSHEAIWQLPSVIPGISNWEAGEIIPFGSADAPAYLLSPIFLQSFEVGDRRLNRWTIAIASSTGGAPSVIPFKYRDNQSNTLGDQRYMVLRLAEQYLIRAEAFAKIHQPINALADLNQIRHRAGLDDLTDQDEHFLLDAIWHQRSLEFFAEWGHRWLDLKRTARADSVLGASKPNWRSSAQWWPIPQDQLDANAALTQNPGY